jgi:hypothetical protein
LTLTQIEIQHIPHLWEWVRNGLNEVKQRSSDLACPWIPEDVYYALISRAATLWVMGAEDGFMVAQRVESSYERVMFVWALWAPAGTMVRHKDEVMAAIDDLARSAGLFRIRMFSPRDAWAATNLFVPVSTIFEREVRT